MTYAAFTGFIDLASEAIGGKTLLCSDDFFAEMSNLVTESAPIFKPDAYVETGKWMDGWESRRRRTPGHDWCIIELGVRGCISGFDIDTAHFLGNHPPFASIDACRAPAGTSPEHLRDAVTWVPILRQSSLQAGSHNYFPCQESGPWTHLRLNIYPDGGVARLRVYGSPLPEEQSGRINLASAAQGGMAVACSDMFFGHASNLLLPRPAPNMGGGWESRRRRDDGLDWCILQLGRPGHVEEVAIDTRHFKGNFPDQCSLEGIYWPDAPAHGLIQSPDWTPLVGPTKMSAHTHHPFPIAQSGPYTHLRLQVHPCGGVSRFSAHGIPFEGVEAEATVRSLNEAPPDGLFELFHRCCGSERWASAMVAAHPFGSAAELFGVANHIWWHLEEGDWRQAFGHHPEIGSDMAALEAAYPQTADLSAQEQAGVANAEKETLTALAAANTTYRDRFGYVFLICATGKSASEMLLALQERTTNPPENEIRYAAAEQTKITRLRLEKLL
jgi:allantoicase